MKDAVNFKQLQSHPVALSFHHMTKTIEGLGGGLNFTDALNELSKLSDAVEAEINSKSEAENIADAVIAWMVARGFLDAESEYRAADIMSALNELSTD